MHALGQNRLPWNIAIIVDATFLTRSSLHTENAKKFNHGKGYVIGYKTENQRVIEYLASNDLIVKEMIKRTELSRLNQLMTKINGMQRLKNVIQQALKGRCLENHHIFQGLPP
jgi:hypothetical protein